MLDYPLVEAVAAVLEAGSFEKAAGTLGLTPSAVSQRVKLLEERVGAVLVVRGQPCTATLAGARIRRHAAEVGLLEQRLGADLGRPLSGEARASVRIAVNADSLATWFVEAMAGIRGRLFDLVIDDQSRSAEWLRRGEVSAAVSARTAPVQGCRSRELGALRYVATASPAFVARWFADGVNAETLRRAPAMTFSVNDELQTGWIRRVTGKRLSPPMNWFPATQAFVEASLAGIAWGMNPLALVAEHLAAGRLVPLIADKPYDVPLYWQWSRAVEPALKDVTDAVVRTARRHLLQRKK
jgi:LysR family transcriptional regulator (chromosome initiation inhibitor)